MKERKIVGKVTQEEGKQIQKLFEHKNGLLELAKILDGSNTDLYNKLVEDLGKTNILFQDWWSKMSEKYQWESQVDGNWEIDFDNNDIYLNYSE